MPGDIVRDIDRGSIFHNKQGLVVEVQLRFWRPPQILVRFDRRDSLMFYSAHDERERNSNWEYYMCPARELRREPDWDPEYYANKHFGTMWRTVAVLKARLSPRKRCMVDECSHEQAEIVWINIWGSVCNVYLCTAHAAHYKRWSCMDMFPYRPSWKEQKESA